MQGQQTNIAAENSDSFVRKALSSSLPTTGQSLAGCLYLILGWLDLDLVIVGTIFGNPVSTTIVWQGFLC